MPENAIEIDNLTRSFGNIRALDGLSLGVPEGSVFGLIGPNGAGKTTTINCIADLLAPDSGSVKVFGKELKRDGIAVKKEMGILFENTADLFMYLSGEEQLRFVGEVYGLDRWTIEERMDTLFEYFELESHKWVLIEEYSKGMRKKLALASILMHNPRLIILDEVFDGLDTLTIVKVKKLLRKLRESGKTILITSHILSFIEDLSDDVAIINKGRVVFQSKTAELRKKIKNGITNETYGSLEEIFLDITKTEGDDDPAVLDWIE